MLVAGVTTALADGYHVVCAGETLYAIGRRYGVNPYTIASANSLSNPNYIRVGQVLYIPSSTGWNAPGPQPQWPPRPHLPAQQPSPPQPAYQPQQPVYSQYQYFHYWYCQHYGCPNYYWGWYQHH
jgi:LysM repeat protein